MVGEGREKKKEVRRGVRDYGELKLNCKELLLWLFLEEGKRDNRKWLMEDGAGREQGTVCCL